MQCSLYGNGIDDYFSNIFKYWCRIGLIACNGRHIAVHQLWWFVANDDLVGGGYHFAFYEAENNRVREGPK